MNPPAGGPHPSLLARLADGDVGEAVVDVVIAELCQAGRPVSLPGLCNVLWFGRGELGGYDGATFACYTDRTTYVAHDPVGDRTPDKAQDAVPLGAIVTVRLGSDEAWGEVAWREGAHPGLESGWVPGWLAGAPSGVPEDGPPPPDFAAASGPVVLRERLVLDFDGCFGPELSPRTRIERAKRRCDQLDCWGHVVAPFVYPPGLDEADEVGFWAAWTAAHHPDALAAAGVPADASVLAEAAGILGAALLERPDVRSFGPYHIANTLYEQLVALDASDDGPLRRCVRSLRHVPNYEQVAWASMSARLAESSEREAMEETGWPTQVTCASLLALDTLALDAADGDWDGVHVRVDDLWQGGGLWRAERLEATTPVAADPAIALGLGWVAHAGGTIERVTAEDDDGADDDLEWDFTDTAITWTTHLSRSEVDDDRLRVPPRVAELIAAHIAVLGQDQLLVILEHDGSPATQDFSPLVDRCLSVQWPLGVWPGVTVRATWPFESRKITARTTALPEQVRVGGLTYTHEFNMAVALAAAGLAERTERTATVAQLVRAVVRRHGAVLDDGRLALGLDEVVTYCFGPDGEVAPGYGRDVLARSVTTAVRSMAAAGIATLEDGMVCVSDRHTRAGRAADTELLRRFAAAHTRRLRREARKHFVPATVVTLPAGWRRSAAKDLGYDEVAGTDLVPAGGLAPNQTWRTRHTRGARLDPNIARDLERALRVFKGIGGDETVTTELENAVSNPGAGPDR